VKSDAAFDSAGLKLAGHLCTPEDGVGGRRPAIVVSHPAIGVKEQAAGLYALRLAHSGLIALTFDASRSTLRIFFGRYASPSADRSSDWSVERRALAPLRHLLAHH
jgi:fermentation-respiration switch protein FrsA (DUF1100 family)